MKVYFISICLIFFGIDVNSQFCQPLEDDKFAIDYISTLKQLSNSIYYLSSKLYLDSSLNIVNSVHYFNKMSIDSNMKVNTEINLNSSGLTFLNKQLFWINDTFYAFALYSTSNLIPFYGTNNLFNLHLLKLDINLSLLEDKTIQNLSGISDGGNTFQFISDSTVIFTRYTNPTTFYSAHSIINIYTGDISANFQDNSFNIHRQWINFNDSTFGLINNIGSIKIFDKTLNNISTLQLNPPNNFSIINLNSVRIYQNHELLINAIMDSFVNNRINCLFSYDIVTQSYQILHTDTVTSPISNSWQDVDLLDSNFIFTSNCYVPCNVYSFGSNCTNSFDINQFDTFGNLNWKKTIGIDAAYFVFSILATPDSGCIVFLNRYSSAINNLENDIYYIKLDNTGMQQNGFLPTLVSNYNSLFDSLIVYPNPTNRYIHILHNYSHDKLSFQIVDLYGRILSRGIYNNYIDLSKLQEGMYLIKVYNNYYNRTFKFEKE